MTTKDDMGAVGSTSTEVRTQPGWLVTPPSRLQLADPNALLLESLKPAAPVPFMTRLLERLAYPSGTAQRAWPIRAFAWLESRAAWQRWLLTAASGAALVLGLYQSAASSASLQAPSSARAELRTATVAAPPGPPPQGVGNEPTPPSSRASNAQPAARTLPGIEVSTLPVAKPHVKPKRAVKRHTQKARASRHGTKAQQRRRASRLSTPRS